MSRSRPGRSRRGVPAKSDPVRSRTGSVITYRPNMMRAREGAAHALDDARANVLDLLDDVAASPLHYPAWEPSLAACRSSAESLQAEIMRKRDGVGRVVVIGRTKAGKSTLRYVLTGQGQEGIGRGGQRTTQRAIRYRWRGYEIADTPGVGGIGTEADTQIALDAAADADLVLWVTTSDGVQLATEAPVLRAAEGRPLLVLVNHKSTFALEEIAAGLDVGVILTDRTGLEDRIRSRLAGVGVEDPQIEHVHLGLARCARYELNDSELVGLSGVLAVEESLAAAIARAARNRPTTSARRLQVELAALAEALRTTASLIDSHRRHLQSEHKELLLAVRGCRESYLRATGSFADALQEEAREELATALEAAGLRPHRGEAEKILTECVAEIAAGLREKLGDAVAAAHAQALRELPPAHRPAEEPDTALDTLFAVELLPLQGDPQIGVVAQRAVRVGVGLLGAIAVIASDGFLAPLVVASLGGEAGRRLVGSFVPDRETEQSRRDDSIEANRTLLDDALSTWRRTIRGELEAASKALTQPAVQHLEELRHRIERYAEWVALLRRAARDLSNAAANLTDGG